MCKDYTDRGVGMKLGLMQRTVVERLRDVGFANLGACLGWWAGQVCDLGFWVGRPVCGRAWYALDA
jgi:hypothetical protein